MTTLRRRGIYPFLLIVLANCLVLAGSLAPVVYMGLDPGPPIDFAFFGWAGWLSLVFSLVAFVVLIVGGVVLKVSTRIPALVLGLLPSAVAGIGLIGAEIQIYSARADAINPSASSTRMLAGLAEGLYQALHVSFLGSFVASAMMLGCAFTIALRHWPSKGSLSSGARIGLFGGVLVLASFIVVSLFWAPLAGFGLPIWIATLIGLVSIAVAAHAIRNDPGDAANVQAAGELWITMLFSLGALAFAVSTSYASVWMVVLGSVGASGSAPDLSAFVEAWSQAEQALKVSALYAVPLVFAAIASMLSRESLGSWGLRRAVWGIVLLPVFFLVPTVLQYTQAVSVARALVLEVRCSSSVFGDAGSALPAGLSAGQGCPADRREGAWPSIPGDER